MRIAFYGGQTAGLVVLLTLLARKDCKVVYVVPQDNNISTVARQYKIKTLTKSSLNKKPVISKLKKNIDVFICCHGKTILLEAFVTNIKSVNIHPCLYLYKGAKPVQRLIADKNPKASVGSHFMTKEIDLGKVLVEYFTNIDDIEKKTEAEIYSQLYPIYVKVLNKTLDKLRR